MRHARGMTPRGMTRFDLGFSVLLVALGMAVIIESWRMPRLENLAVEPYSAPGLVPGILGIVLSLLGLILLLRSIKRVLAGDPGAATEPLDSKRFLLAVAITLSYAAGLVGNIPFWLATFLFVTVFIIVFEHPAKQPVWAWFSACLQGAITAAVVTLVFRYLFLVRLP